MCDDLNAYDNGSPISRHRRKIIILKSILGAFYFLGLQKQTALIFPPLIFLEDFLRAWLEESWI